MFSLALSRFLFLLSGVVACPLRSSELDFSGIVYAYHSGTSGSGTGSVRLFRDGKTSEFDFQKPIKGDLKFPSCGNLGVHWSVAAKSRVNQDRIIERAICNGQADESIYSAWTTVVRFLNAASSGDLINARNLVISSRRSRNHNGFEVQLGSLEFGGYKPSSNGGNCLEVDRKISSDHIIFLLPDFCGISLKGNLLRLSIPAIRESGQWRVTGFFIRSQ